MAEDLLQSKSQFIRNKEYNWRFRNKGYLLCENFDIMNSYFSVVSWSSFIIWRGAYGENWENTKML